VAEFKESYS